jgi:hypothetical protein
MLVAPFSSVAGIIESHSALCGRDDGVKSVAQAGFAHGDVMTPRDLEIVQCEFGAFKLLCLFVCHHVPIIEKMVVTVKKYFELLRIVALNTK